MSAPVHIDDMLASLVENSPAVVSIKDLQLRYIAVNRRFEALHGVARRSIQGKTDYEILPKQVADVLRARDRAVLVSGAPLECDEMIPLSDGPHTYFVTRFPVAESAGEPPYGLASIAIDVTERKRAESSGRVRAEETLQTKEALFRSLIENTSDIVTILDAEGRIRYSSPSIQRLLGYPAQDRLGQNIFEMVHPEDVPRLRELFAVALKRPGASGKAEARVLHADGSWRHLECIGKNLMDEAVINGFVVTSRDITDRKRVEAALRESETALKRSEAQLRQLTGGLLKAQEEERRRISLELHDDFNQRLAMLVVEVETLERDVPERPAGIRKRLRTLRERAGVISDDMRRTARRLHPSILEHLGLVSAMRAFCSDVEASEKIKVRFSHRLVPNPLPRDVSLCVYRIAQEALRNVVRHARATEATVSISYSNSEIHLAVADNGVGFRRNPGKSGAGLGLVSMQERVRLVDGTLSVWSNPGSGTKIDVRVPFSGEIE